MKLFIKQVISAIRTIFTAYFLLTGNLIGITSASSHNIELSTVFESSNCTKEDFEQNGFCELSCISESKRLHEWHWIYYIETPSKNATLYDDVDISDVTVKDIDYTEISLKLANYSAGYYRCWYHYIDLNATGFFDYFVTNDFKIDHAEEGVLLSCNTSEQCLSLDASCVNSTCQCQYPFVYPLQYTGSHTTTACLKGVGPFRPCNIDQQCSAAGDHYECNNGICNCSPNSTYIYVGEVNEYLCLLPALIGQSCQYSEECMLTHPNSWCYENVCGCADDYLYNATLNFCINSTSETPYWYPDDNESDVTLGDVIAIVIEAMALVVMVLLIVVACILRR